MMIELSWPAKALSPNYRSRSHWPRTNAMAAAKKEAWGATLAAMHGIKPTIAPGQIGLIVTAYPPTSHSRDDDNLIASLKAHRDGIAKALGIDDARFEQRPLQWAEPVKGGRIVVSIMP